MNREDLHRKVVAMLGSRLPPETAAEFIIALVEHAVKRGGGRWPAESNARQKSINPAVCTNSAGDDLFSGSDPNPGSDPEPSQPIGEISELDEPPRPPGFDEFWQLYPRRVGKSAAIRVWKRLRPPMTKVRAALSWQKKDPWWVAGNAPHPATWINKGRWDDEPVDFAALTAAQAQGRHPGVTASDPHCRYHLRGQHQRQQAPKHEWSASCPECKHLGAWTKPRAAGEPTAIGDLLADMNGGKQR